MTSKPRLAAEVIAAYLRVRRLARRMELLAVLAQLRSDGRADGVLPLADVERLGRAVRRTLAVLPADSRCLMSSLVLIAMLARRGVDGALVIGVRPGGAVDFGAHAWVEFDGHPVLPPGAAEFPRLVTL